MSDFKTGLLLKRYVDRAWWGEYSDLNRLQNPGENGYQVAQRRILNNYDKQLKKKCQELNNFLNEMKKIPDNLIQELESETTKRLDALLMELGNAGLNVNRGSSNSILFKEKKTKEELNSEIYRLESTLNKMSTLLMQLTSQTKVPVNQINKTLSLLAGNNGFKSAFYGQGTTRSYIQAKSKVAELMARDILTSHPDWAAVVSGDWYNQGQQLIEDLFVFNTKKTNLGMVNVEIFTDTKTKTKTSIPLKELITLEGTVHLTDDGLRTLRKMKEISVQVKSGADQDIFTQAARNSISLRELYGLGNLGDRMYQLYMLDLEKPQNWFKQSQNQNSPALNNLANLRLSYGITNTVLSKNEVYYTELGFTTAYEWMLAKNAYITFKDRITAFTTNFMDMPRKIIIHKGNS